MNTIITLDRLDHISKLIEEEVEARALERVSEFILDEKITPEALIALLDKATSEERTNFLIWALFAHLAEKGRIRVMGCDPDVQKDEEGLLDFTWKPELSNGEIIVFEPEDERVNVGVLIMPAYTEYRAK